MLAKMSLQSDAHFLKNLNKINILLNISVNKCLCRGEKPVKLTNGHENVINIHGGFGGSFHEQQTVVIGISLCLLQR